MPLNILAPGSKLPKIRTPHSRTATASRLDIPLMLMEPLKSTILNSTMILSKLRLQLVMQFATDLNAKLSSSGTHQLLTTELYLLTMTASLLFIHAQQSSWPKLTTFGSCQEHKTHLKNSLTLHSQPLLREYPSTPPTAYLGATKDPLANTFKILLFDITNINLVKGNMYHVLSFAD